MRIFDIWLAYRISLYCFILIGWMLMPIMKIIFLLFIYFKAFEIDDNNFLLLLLKEWKFIPSIIIFYGRMIWQASNQHHGTYLSSYNIHIAINDTLHFISTDERETHHCDHHKKAGTTLRVLLAENKKKCFLSRGRANEFFNFSIYNFFFLHHHLYILLVAFFSSFSYCSRVLI